MNNVVAIARSTQTDSELIAKIVSGNLGGLGELFDRYEPDVKRFIGRLGVRPSEVDDLVQLAFLDVARAAVTFDGRSSARSWLFGIAAIVVRRYRRSMARVAAGLMAWAREPRFEGTPPDTASEINQSAARAARALEQLSPKKRAVFVMVVLEDCSGEETARALGIPVATVWTRLHHARRELRESLAKESSS
jgi:RNA polymerase sigma factor (sigma-70 family)